MSNKSDRLDTYAAALLVEWFGGRSGRDHALEASTDDGVFIARGGGSSMAVAVGRLWEPESDPTAEAARASTEERLSAGLVRGPHLLLVPPRGVVPTDEPDASDFVQRVQQAAAPLQAGGPAGGGGPRPGERGEKSAEGGVAVRVREI